MAFDSNTFVAGKVVDIAGIVAVDMVVMDYSLFVHMGFVADMVAAGTVVDMAVIDYNLVAHKDFAVHKGSVADCKDFVVAADHFAAVVADLSIGSR